MKIHVLNIHRPHSGTQNNGQRNLLLRLVQFFSPNKKTKTHRSDTSALVEMSTLHVYLVKLNIQLYVTGSAVSAQIKLLLASCFSVKNTTNTK